MQYSFNSWPTETLVSYVQGGNQGSKPGDCGRALNMQMARIAKGRSAAREVSNRPQPRHGTRHEKLQDLEPTVCSRVPETQSGWRLPGPPAVAAMVTDGRSRRRRRAVGSPQLTRHRWRGNPTLQITDFRQRQGASSRRRGTSEAEAEEAAERCAGAEAQFRLRADS